MFPFNFRVVWNTRARKRYPAQLISCSRHASRFLHVNSVWFTWWLWYEPVCNFPRGTEIYIENEQLVAFIQGRFAETRDL